MDLNLMQKLYAELKTVRQSLLESLTNLENQIEDGLLPASGQQTVFQEQLDRLFELQTRILSFVEEGTELKTMEEVACWIKDAARREDSAARFLSVVPTNPAMLPTLLPYREQVNALLSGSEDSDFRAAIDTFLGFLDQKWGYTSPDFAEKAALLSRSFNPVLCGLLFGNQLRFDETTHADGPSAQPMQKAPASEAGIVADRKPIRPLDVMLVPDTLQISGSAVNEFDRDAFLNLMARQQPAQKIVTNLARYFALSSEQMAELVGISRQRLNDCLLNLTNSGFVNRYHIRSENGGSWMLFVLGKACSTPTALADVEEQTNVPVAKLPVAQICQAAVQNSAAALAAVARARFLKIAQSVCPSCPLTFSQKDSVFGQVKLESEKSVWFFAPYLNKGEEVSQLAALKSTMKAVPKGDSVILSLPASAQPEDWNVVLIDAKLSILNVFYQIGSKLISAHSQEEVSFKSILPVEQPPVAAPVQVTAPAKPAPVQETAPAKPAPVQDTPAEPAPVQEKKASAGASSESAAGKTASSDAHGGTVMDLSKLPELPVRNNKINHKNGIFEIGSVPGADGNAACVQTVFQLCCQRSVSSGILYARALSRCVPEVWLPVCTMLAYAFDDPMFTHDYSFINIQNVFDRPIPGCSPETVKRYELCAFLRMLFSDQIDMGSLHLMKVDVLETSLRPCELLRSCPEIRSLLEDLCGFVHQFQRGFGVEATNRLRSVDKVERRRRVVQKRATELLAMRLEESTARHPRVKSVREDLFGSNGIMTSLLRPVAAGIRTGLEKTVQECRKFQKKEAGGWVINQAALNDLIDALWRKSSVFSSRDRNARLLDSQKIPIRNNMEEVISLFSEWVELTSSSNENAPEYSKVYHRLLNHLEGIEMQLSTALAQADSNSFEEAASILAVMETMADEKQLLAGQRKNPEHFYIDFLTSDQVELDPTTLMPILDESVSIIPDYELWTRIIAHQKQRKPLEEYIRKVMAGRGLESYDFGRLLALFRYLRSLNRLPEGVTLEQIQNLERKLFDDIDAMPPEIQRMEDAFNAEMEMAEGYGRFVNLGTKDRILHEVRDWYRPVADHSCNYGFYNRKMLACSKAVDEQSRQLKKQYMEKLTMLRDSLPVEVRDKTEDNILDAIEKLICQRIYSVADDYMRLAELGHTAPPVSYMRSGNTVDYFAKFLEDYPRLFKEYGSDAGTPLLEIYSMLNPAWYDRSRVLKDARSMIRSWPRSIDKDNQEESVRKLLGELGFEVESVTPSANPTKKMTKLVTIAPTGNPASEYQHPIAEFGSWLPNDGLTVHLHFGKTEPSRIMNDVRSYGSNGNPIVILLDYSLSLSDRRTFAFMMKQEGINARTTVLIDRILAVYLAQVPHAERIKAMLQCALPFDYMIPYKTDDGASVIPPEMFIGRRHELHSIESRSGTHIIYGGRQLGKSALLNRAKVNVDNRPEGRWGIYVPILKREMDAALKEVYSELVNEGFLEAADVPENWQELCTRIRERMNSTEKPVKQFLLLMDEADYFIRSCEADGYAALEQMLELQSKTQDRFKFVLAGLHNVLRYSKKAVVNNQSLNRLAPLCIKPLKYSEGSELLEKPLFYLGFRMKQEHVALISQILSSCNYYPGLIHYYAYMLLSAIELNNRNTEAPPYYLDEAQIRLLLQDAGFRFQIGNKLDMTLGDGEDEGNYYRILAYALAYCFYDDSEGASFGFTASELMHVCEQFRIASVVNLGEYTVQALLEEMVELNVLRSSIDKKLFSFNRRSFLEMLGDFEAVWSELEGFANAE